MLGTNEISADRVQCEQNNLNGFVGMLKAWNGVLDSPYCPSCVYGVDFSGAKNAGTKIWIASATITGDVLKLHDCHPAEVLPGSARDCDQCLVALRRFITTQKTCAFGLDFPFGVPHDLVKANNWEEFVLSFGGRYPNPEQFREAFRTAAYGHEYKRVTDRENQTPLCPYNLRLYRQTFFGIRDILAPLVREQLVCVLPMQNISPNKPWIFEICPASTVKKQLGIKSFYKGGTEEKYFVRKSILHRMEETSVLLIPDFSLRSRILNDRHGDALDSVIAAFATFRALGNPACFSVPRTDAYAFEGYVYV